MNKVLERYSKKSSAKPVTKYDFFFQAEDGIRDTSVTGVQTCALPMFYLEKRWDHPFLNREPLEPSVPIQENIGTNHF